MDEQSDTELVRRFQRGDQAAFHALVQRFQDPVYRLAAVWLDDAQQADDAVQEVFLRSFRGLRGFRFRSAPFTWLYRMTKNVCFEINRKRRPEALEHEPRDTAAGPEHLATRLDAARRVRELVSGLPARQREVVLLRIFEDLSVRDTARAMGCREGTVKALLHKAMNKLQAMTGGKAEL
ncbi:MAG: RNA polymerase sigma factor [Chromatiales bacterium]|nr:MAG: RNA polymerase sigma factor [Chromatiales bacterium]